MNVAERLKQYQHALQSVYVPDNADATHGRAAQVMGAIIALDEILKAKANGQFIARKQDIEELLADALEE